jgi:hypothetical protein
VASGPAVDAFATEAGRLTEIISGVDDAALDRASPCPPWTVAARAAGPALAPARDLDQAWRDAWAPMRDAPQGRVVRTRHGDRMLFTEFRSGPPMPRSWNATDCADSP